MLPVHDIEVPPSERRFHRLSGRVSLDLVATVGERWRRRFERLRTTSDLDRWLATMGWLVDGAASPPALDAARELRGAIELLAVGAIAGEPAPQACVAVVNGFAARADAPPQLVDGRASVPPAPPAALLSSIARDAVDLFGSSLATRIRECAADDCALLYVDMSRAATRRWCSMRGCGNRTKVMRHRQSGPAGSSEH